MLGGAAQSSDRAALLDSRLILLWGTNPAENHMSPNTDHFVAAARDRGARVILLDPRLSDSGVLADEWVPVRPGTDVALVAAMAYVMERDGLVDRDFLASHTTGYEAYRRYVLGTADLGAADLGRRRPWRRRCLPQVAAVGGAHHRRAGGYYRGPGPRLRHGAPGGAAGRLGAAAVDLWRAGGPRLYHPGVHERQRGAARRRRGLPGAT
jgi:hypothetical protein